MALIDDNLMFCSDVALNTGAAGTVYLLGSQIDANTVRDFGNGRPVYLFIDVGTEGITAASDATGTLQFILASDDSASVNVSTGTRHYLTPTYGTSNATPATLVPGQRLFECAIPSDGSKPYEQFLGILQVPVTRAITAGTVNIGLTLAPTSQRYYPNGI